MHSSIHTNNQSIRWSILKKGKYLLLEITWDDYVLYYILKYIPPLCNNVLTQHNNVPDAHQGTKIFLPKFLWTSPIPIPSISMLKNNDWTTRGSFSFSGWIACKLHADPMIPQIPPKSTFPVENFRRFFLHLNERKPNNIPKFRSNQRIFIFWPIWHSTPYLCLA